ncbi:MAG: TetR/AcrR family transcriptional regulator [Microbacterium arborescens]
MTPAEEPIRSTAADLPRRTRSDARQNADALLAAARAVFARSGVDAPARSIAAEAGVGVGTLYRHFPNRAELVAAVFTTEIDATAAAAAELLADLAPGEALDRWIERFTRFVATKQGLAAALHSGDPAFESLPGHLIAKLGPAIGSLVTAAARSGDIRPGVDPVQLLQAIGDLSHRTPSADGSPNAMVRLLLDGLRLHDGADTPVDNHP